MDTKKLWAFREELVNELVEIDRKWTAARLLASLEPSIKEKVKAQLLKGKNNVREVFVQDYEQWIKFESQGGMKLNGRFSISILPGLTGKKENGWQMLRLKYDRKNCRLVLTALWLDYKIDTLCKSQNDKEFSED